MIQIDDAGSGSLVGGTCIGLFWLERNLYKCDFVPLDCYNPENFKNKLYQVYVVEIISRFFKELSVPEDEPIQLCQGYIFDALRDHLTFKNLTWKSVKIEGVLQEKVEKTFADYSVSLGLPQSYISYTKYPFHFHKLLRWVYADYDHRKILCKTGWKSWQKYGNLPILISNGNINTSGYFCLKCGKKIKARSPIKILEFFSNKKNILYIHQYC
jgi:hypothetical protein